MKKSQNEKSPSLLIDARIEELGDWRGKMLGRLRALVKEADPDVVEEWKWRGVPVWSDDGLITTGETYKTIVKMTFAKGAALEDPSGLFNSSLEGNTRRAIDFHEGEAIDEAALKALVRAAVALNKSTSSAKKPRTSTSTSRGKATSKAASTSKAKSKPTRSPSKAGARAKPRVTAAKSTKMRKGREAARLLSGGNPQIAKADGDAPVEAYIAAMPGWKRDVAKRLDALIVRSVPGVHKAVKWNSPMYGIEGRGFFLGLHTFTRYVKVAFFRGMSLRPLPPGASRQKDTRYIDIHEDDELDETQMATWLKQAAALPGWLPGRPF